MPTEAMVALIGLAVALTTILSIRFGRQIARGLLIIGGLAAVIAIAYALAEQARASRQAAKAASIAAAGQAVESVAVTLLATLLVIVVILAAAAVVYLLFRIKRAESGRGRKWLPGPNARWQQVETGSASQAAALNQLIMMEVLRTLRSLRQPPMQPPCLPTGRPTLPGQDVYALPAWDDSGDDDDLPDLLSDWGW